jgi:hypothetical protein
MTESTFAPEVDTDSIAGYDYGRPTDTAESGPFRERGLASGDNRGKGISMGWK